jgi:hypothetical protein
MALHDKKVTRWFATGIAGLSVVADSLSAIKYAKVKVIRDADGLAVDYEVEGLKTTIACRVHKVDHTNTILLDVVDDIGFGELLCGLT